MHAGLILLAGYGLCFALADATITKGIRHNLLKFVPWLQSLFVCSFCLGFWTTMAIAFVAGIHGPTIVLYGFSGAVVSLFLDSLLSVIELLITKLEK